MVDDREDNLLSIETILETDGYQLVKANSGRQALKILLKEFDFALILMDVKMPNLNGFETASLIYEREKLKHIPIIFITANNYGDENIFKGYKAGAVDYIYKPINPDLLRAKVSVFIELYKKNHQLLAQEKKLIAINKNLENEIRERKISEQKIHNLNSQLLENIAQLEEANKELDRFAFMASHDLQEPLRKIRTFSDLLYIRYNNNLDENGKMHIHRIKTAAERMQLLIQDILTFSKMSLDKIEYVDSDLNIIIKEVLADLQETAQKEDATITIGSLPTLPVNPVLIRPLFSNLISNAIKYRRPDVKPVINIFTENEVNEEQKNGINTNKKYCRIYVQDNGIGFDQKYAEQIFGMFQRLHSNKEIEGTGIGLALCKKIVDEHKGFISARGEINKGSTFVVSLPVLQMEELPQGIQTSIIQNN